MRPSRQVLDHLVQSAPVVAQLPEVDMCQVEDAIERGWESTQRIPEHYREATITVPEVRQWVDELVRRACKRPVPNILDGPSLVLLGPVGTGKTYQAYAAIKALVLSGAYCRWRAVTSADLYAQLRPRHGVDSEAEFRAVADARVLVLDDLGVAKHSDWTEEVIYRLVNHRYERHMPTVFTSNLGPRELVTHLGDRVASRLAEMTTRVVLGGPDRRRAAKETAA